MTDDLARFVEDNWKADFDDGRLAAGYEAALFCIKNGVPIPEWLTSMVEGALKRDFLTSEGRGRGGEKHVTSSRKVTLIKFILKEVDRLTSLEKSKVEAFEMIATDLSNHDTKRWTAEMVKKTYYTHS